MSSPIANKSSMVRSYRKFPEDPKLLITELSRGWVESANAINDRVIGFYNPAPTITGKQYSFNGQVPQSLRQTFTFTGSTTSIAHGLQSITQIVAQYGWFTDGSIWYPLPYVNPVAANQVGIYTDSTNINIVKGGSAPVITSGTIVLEWLQNQANV